MGFTRSKQEINYDTIVLDISRSMAEVRKGFKKNWRYYLGLAERNGLEIREGVTRKDYEDFLPVYSDLLDRKGLQPDIDITRWIKLQHVLPESEKPRIFLAFHNGNIVAGLVVSAIGGTGYPIVAASHSEGKKFYGSNLLHWKAIEWLKTMGCHSYDLSGIDPEKNPGTYHFKTGFGGREVSTIGVFEDCTNGMSKALVRLGEPIRSTVIRFSRKIDKWRIKGFTSNVIPR
jgi:lipid II:glycine glycyltransferase (peptidoglycan interpeptide bridge formation enzyme)